LRFAGICRLILFQFQKFLERSGKILGVSGVFQHFLEIDFLEILEHLEISGFFFFWNVGNLREILEILRIARGNRARGNRAQAPWRHVKAHVQCRWYARCIGPLHT
jgi:hypothetical protein